MEQRRQNKVREALAIVATELGRVEDQVRNALQIPSGLSAWQNASSTGGTAIYDEVVRSFPNFETKAAHLTTALLAASDAMHRGNRPLHAYARVRDPQFTVNAALVELVEGRTRAAEAQLAAVEAELEQMRLRVAALRTNADTVGLVDSGAMRQQAARIHELHAALGDDLLDYVE